MQSLNRPKRSQDTAPPIEKGKNMWYDRIKKKRGAAMPFQIIRNDITAMQVDAIVDSAHPDPVIGGGADGQIHRKAGPKLLKARQKIGSIAPGTAHITPGYDLDAKYVIHTVGPIWSGGAQQEEQTLRRCYEAALELAHRKRCGSIAFPLISSGAYGFPKDRALNAAIVAISAFLSRHEMMVYLVVFDRDSYRLSDQLFHEVSGYISDHYALERLHREPTRRPALLFRRQEHTASRSTHEDAAPAYAMPCAPSQSLKELLSQTDAGFTETLLRLIDRSGKKDAEVYKRANLSRQHFSKIRKDPHYKPTKPTALALALALELDLDQTRDLISRAGYALTNASKFDVIIMYFIQRGHYDLFDINTTLFEFDQPLLGT